MAGHIINTEVVVGRPYDVAYAESTDGRLLYKGSWGAKEAYIKSHLSVGDKIFVFYRHESLTLQAAVQNVFDCYHPN